MWKLIIISIVIILLLIGSNILFIKGKIKETKRADEAEKEVRKLKGNIVKISQSIARDTKLVKGGDTIAKAIKKAKTNEDAHNIMRNVSADLDGLL